MNKALIQIVERHKSTKEDSFIEVFAGDDKKSGKKPYNKFFNISTTTIEEIQDEADTLNNAVYGVFLNINPLSRAKRIKANVKKIMYAFIDLDDAEEDHNELVKTKLKELNITYSYNAKSGHGYHFLIPIDLDTSNEPKIKGFLNYMKENCTSKVDLATADLGRLMRFPNSFHNKDDDSKKLITLHSHIPTEEEIKINNEELLKYQLEQKKGKKDVQYQQSIKREDTFFSELLFNTGQWQIYRNLLDKSKNRNDFFIKNLGLFIAENPNKSFEAESFLQSWEPSRVAAMKGWEKKAKTNNMSVNYFELLKWSNENELEDFIVLLKKQTKSSFLDRYEFYYLEDERQETSYLLYYPERNYYITKSLNEILNNIYYDCLESGIDLITEFSLNLLDDWEELSFKKQLGIIFSCIHKKIITEKRIRVVFNINYEPTDEKFVYYEKKRFFNTYNQTELWNYNEPAKKYQFKHIKELLMNLSGNDEKNYNYLNKWLAWIIQNPTEKLPTALILQGRQGSGKGTFKNLILDNIFGNNCQEINQTHLESSFNSYLLGKQIIVANEVMHNENRQTLPNILKNLVTDETLTISRKFKNEIVSKNYTHWIFCTNSDNPIKIEADDRRYSVFFSNKLKKGFVKELRNNLDYELKEYISYLKSLEVDFYEVSEPIMTLAKEEIIELNKDSIERFIEYLKQFNYFKQVIDSFTKKDFQYCEHTANGIKYIPTDIIYLTYEEYCSKFNERGRFNKQTFSKKLAVKGLKNDSVYIPDTKKSKRVFELDEIHKIMEIN